MSSEQIVTQGATEPQTPPKPRRRMPTKWLVLIAAVIVANVIAINVAPPFPREGQPGEPCAFPVCFIDGTLEFPAPHSIFALTNAPAPGASELITFYPSISSTLFTMWVVMAIVLVGSILMVHGGKIGGRLIPGRAQNVFEWFYEFLQDFGIGIAGPAARPYIPIFVGVLPAHPVLELERADPAGRSRGATASADQRRQRHARAGARRLPHVRVRGLPPPRSSGLSRQVLPAVRIQEGDRRGWHRAVRRPRRTHARVRQADHALHATLRQHLRWRGRARRDHRR